MSNYVIAKSGQIITNKTERIKHTKKIFGDVLITCAYFDNVCQSVCLFVYDFITRKINGRSSGKFQR